MVMKITNIYDRKIPKVYPYHTCLALISLDSILNKDGNYCPKVFRNIQYKYIENAIKHINDNLSGFLPMMILMKNIFYFNECMKNFSLVYFSVF